MKASIKFLRKLGKKRRKESYKSSLLFPGTLEKNDTIGTDDKISL